MNITAKEYAMMNAIINSEYGECGCLDNMPWSWAVCGNHASAAVLGSLCKKGLARQNGRGEDASCRLTEAGKAAYVAKFGTATTWQDGDSREKISAAIDARRAAGIDP